MTTTPTPQRYRVTVLEWLSHDAIIEASSREAAEAEARRLWDQNAEGEHFQFRDSGIDGVEVDPL